MHVQDDIQILRERESLVARVRVLYFSARISPQPECDLPSTTDSWKTQVMER